MKKLIAPELEILNFKLRDVICASNVNVEVTDKPGDGVIDNWIT